MFRSATFKLTMWYLAIVMAISLIFSAALYHVATNEVRQGLHNENQRIFNEFPTFNELPVFKNNDAYSDSSHRILYRLIGFNIIVFFGAGFASYWLARRTLEPIQEAHEQQKRFTADVSHELRTPLTALKMESEVTLLNKQASKEELRATLQSNLEEAVKIDTLINSLMRLTRLEADELQQNFVKLQANELTSLALEEVGAQASSRGVTLTNKTTGATIIGDQDSMIQLLVILLDNAIKYSSRGTAVTISSRQIKDRTIITIVDQGIGIEASALDQVFNRFYRADDSRNKVKSEGFGLGLSIAKMIADVHDGVITISSRPGHGTSVKIDLPNTVEAASD